MVGAVVVGAEAGWPGVGEPHAASRLVAATAAASHAGRRARAGVREDVNMDAFRVFGIGRSC